MTDSERFKRSSKRKLMRSVESAFGVLRKNYQFGVLNLIFKIRRSGQILVELPGAKRCRQNKNFTKY
jgi:hypothetical protein